MDARVARFGAYEFDFEEMVLRREGKPVPLQPQPTQVLALLLEEPGRLVSRDELKSRLWEDRIVEFDAGLNFSVNQVRRALGDSAAHPDYLETVHRRGYRFIAHVDLTPRHARTASMRSTVARWPWLLTAAVVAGVAFLFAGRDPSSAQGDDLAALPAALRVTYRAGQWLYDQGEAQRALLRLDSVRLAEPGFAPAWALTSHARRSLDDLPGARAAAERAVELDPDLADAHYALGLAAFFDVRGRDAMLAFREAARLAPRETRYRQWYGQALANQLKLDEAIEELEEARRIDPISNLIGADLAMVYIAAARLDEAITFCDGSLELAVDAEPWARDCLLTAHHFKGEDRAAVENARALMELSDASPAEVEATVTLDDYFRWDLARIDRLMAAGEGLNPFQRVRATARLRDREHTLLGLRSLRQARHFSLQWAPRDVWFRFLHEDPEFQAILREAGLPVPSPAS